MTQPSLGRGQPPPTTHRATRRHARQAPPTTDTHRPEYQLLQAQATRQQHQPHQHQPGSTPEHSAQAPVCLARVSEVAPSTNGLVAATRIAAGRAALRLPPCNTLAVPTGSAASAFAFECWLEGFEAAHPGTRLPHALVGFLLTAHELPICKRCEQEGLVQLTVLLLHTRRLAAAAAASGRRSFWSDWMRLLPPLRASTAPLGVWSADELEQLQLQPLQGAMAAANDTARRLCTDLLVVLHKHLPELQLAETVQDVMHALFLAKTRSVGLSSGCLGVLPMHDFMNHSDAPNCSLSTSPDGWHIVTAQRDIEPGTELTLSYTGEPASNLELLLSWGFTSESTQLLDTALPLSFHALPGLDVQLVAAAAAAAAAVPADARSAQLQDGERAVLAAASSLPLQGCWAAAAAASGTQAAGGYSDADAAALVTAAAAVIRQRGMASFCPWTATRADLFELYTPSSKRKHAARVAAVEAAVAGGCSVQAVAALSLQYSEQQLALQRVTAQACLAHVRLQLLQASTTVEQDTQLLLQTGLQRQGIGTVHAMDEGLMLQASELQETVLSGLLQIIQQAHTVPASAQLTAAAAAAAAPRQPRQQAEELLSLQARQHQALLALEQQQQAGQGSASSEAPRRSTVRCATALRARHQHKRLLHALACLLRVVVAELAGACNK